MRVSLCSLNILLIQKVSCHIEITLSMHFPGSREDVCHLFAAPWYWNVTGDHGGRRPSRDRSHLKATTTFLQQQVSQTHLPQAWGRKLSLTSVFLIRPSGCLLSDKIKQSFFMEGCVEKWLSFYKLARVSLSHVCFLCVIIAGEGGESKWFSAWSLIQDSAQLGSLSCWEAGGWQETLLAECLRLFVLALNPL